MKILSLEITDHDILGNLNLNFVLENGNPSNIIIIAGDNGIGKSTILKIINYFLDFTKHGQRPHSPKFLSGKIKLSFMFSTEEEKKKFLDTFSRVYPGKLSKEHEQKIISNKYFFMIINVIDNNGWQDHIEIQLDNELEYLWDTSGFKTISSSLYINTDDVKNTEIISNTSTSDLNNNSNLYISNAQLLIDVKNRDNVDFINSFKNVNINYRLTEENIKLYNKRINIFKNAFNNFFNSKKLFFKEIDDDLNIIFTKNNKEFNAIDLSKGENQIFNFGCQILKNNIIFEGIFIIDEPENGLHPEWQLKLINYYKELTENKKQFLISTHSPFIINSLDNENKLIILKREEGEIVCDRDNKYYSVGEIEEVLKNIPLQYKKGVIQIYVAGDTDKIYLDKMIELYKNEEGNEKLQKIEINYPFGKKGGGDGGDDALKKLCNYNNKIDNIYYLFDHDINKNQMKFDSMEKTLIIEMNDGIKKECGDYTYLIKGIENLIKIEDSDIENFRLKLINKHKNCPKNFDISKQKINFAHYLIGYENIKEKMSVLKKEFIKIINSLNEFK